MLDVNKVIERTRQWEREVLKEVAADGNEQLVSAFRRLNGVTNSAGMGVKDALVALFPDRKEEMELAYRVARDSESDGLKFRKWIVVVPVNRENGHNYALECPTILADADNRRGWRMNSRNHGNGLPNTHSSYRVATDDEIKLCVAAYSAFMEQEND